MNIRITLITKQNHLSLPLQNSLYETESIKNTYLIVRHKDVLESYHHADQSGLCVEAEGAENHHFLGQESEDHETQERVQLEDR